MKPAVSLESLAKSKNDVPLETSIPGASLESILCTEELQRRISRPPDYENENRALVALASALADSPRNILQTLVERVLEMLQADSSGVSLLTKDEKRFYWAAIAGAWQPHIGGGTPRDFGPCGDVLDCNVPMLFTHFERRYTYFLPITPSVEECLLVPFHIGGKAVGTIWAIVHNDRRKFDAEDLRLLESLGRFASAAYQTLTSIDDLKFQIAAREKAETELHQLTHGLEAKIRRLVNANIIGICIWNVEGRIIEANEAFLRIVGCDREDLLSGQVSWREVTPDKWHAVDEQALAELAATGVCEPFEKEYSRKDGSRVPVLVGAALLEGSGSEGVAFVLDLSERKRAEEALGRSEAYLTEAQRLSHTGSWHWNVRTGEVSWSREYCGIFGFDFEKDKPSYPLFIGRVHPEDRPKVEQVLWADVREKRDFDGEYRLLLPDGSIKYLHSLGKCSVSQSGDTEYLGAVMDITERKKSEEALRASEQLARSHVEVMMRSLDVLATQAASEKFIAEMLRTIGQRLRAHTVTLWLRNQQDDSLRLKVMIENDKQVAPDPGYPQVQDPNPWKRNALIQEMLFTKGPVVCDDIEHDVRLVPKFREYLTNRGLKRLLAIPLLLLGEVRGFIGIQHVEGRAYRPEEVELAQALALHVMIAAHEAELGEQRRHAVILEERTRMARDIHDTLAQGFTGVIIQLDTAVDALRDEEPEAAAKHIGRARELARESLDEARRSVHALRPQALEKADFADALKAIITNTTAGTSLQCDFQLKGEPRKLQSSVEENLLHIGQEALTNTLKHACATTFQARLSFDSDAARLELRDNGKGFNIDSTKGGGIGLIGMKERAEQIGATLAITSEPGAGTTIIAVSPVEQPVAT